MFIGSIRTSTFQQQFSESKKYQYSTQECWNANLLAQVAAVCPAVHVRLWMHAAKLKLYLCQSAGCSRTARDWNLTHNVEYNRNTVDNSYNNKHAMSQYQLHHQSSSVSNQPANFNVFLTAVSEKNKVLMSHWTYNTSLLEQMQWQCQRNPQQL